MGWWDMRTTCSASDSGPDPGTIVTLPDSRAGDSFPDSTTHAFASHPRAHTGTRYARPHPPSDTGSRDTRAHPHSDQGTHSYPQHAVSNPTTKPPADTVSHHASTNAPPNHADTDFNPDHPYSCDTGSHRTPDLLPKPAANAPAHGTSHPAPDHRPDHRPDPDTDIKPHCHPDNRPSDSMSNTCPLDHPDRCSNRSPDGTYCDTDPTTNRRADTPAHERPHRSGRNSGLKRY
jgi:hypothetical protein